MLSKIRKKAGKQMPDFTSGPLFVPIFKFALALMVSNLLNSTYHFADNMVIGKFSGDATALAAMSCTGAVSGLLIYMVSGLSSAVTVIISRCFGAKAEERVSRAIHTSILFSFLAGLVVAIIGPIIAYPMLELTGAKSEYIDKAALYLSIVFIGYPFNVCSAFAGCALLSIGEAKRNVIIQALGGGINVILNIIFVAGFGMSVAGVAIATVISNLFCLVYKLVLLYRRNDIAAFRFKRLRLDFGVIRDLLMIGLPSSIQSSLNSVSGLVSTSALNSLSIAAINGEAVAGSISSYGSVASGGYAHSTTIAVTGQNFGAGKYDRVKRALFYILIQLSIACTLVTAISLVFATPLSSLFIDFKLEGADETLAEARLALYMLVPFMLVSAVSTMLQSYLRMAGYSILPLFSSIFSYCGIRVIWNLFIFPLPELHNHFGYILGVVVSLTVDFLIVLVFFIFAQRRIKRKITSQ